MSLTDDLSRPAPAPPPAARSAVDRLVNPRTVVVVGGSTRPDALGNRVVRGLLDGGYGGQLHVVARQPAVVHGLWCTAWASVARATFEW